MLLNIRLYINMVAEYGNNVYYFVTVHISFLCDDRFNFYVLLTVHLSIILVNDQLDAQFFFSIYLFQFSTRFQQPRAHHQENQFYQYNIWYVSPCVGDRLVCRSESSVPTCILDGHLHTVTHTRCCIGKIDSPDDEHEIVRNM
jgi:hypothetical protein